MLQSTFGCEKAHEVKNFLVANSLILKVCSYSKTRLLLQSIKEILITLPVVGSGWRRRGSLPGWATGVRKSVGCAESACSHRCSPRGDAGRGPLGPARGTRILGTAAVAGTPGETAGKRGCAPSVGGPDRDAPGITNSILMAGYPKSPDLVGNVVILGSWPVCLLFHNTVKPS